ncbi:TMM81 protein, partial [Brachypteracias leptosomus]|nr:TMM81 protein [Brachypteracias leptosomus]
MKTLGSSPILGLLLHALCVPVGGSPSAVTIPAELGSVVAEVAVNATSCSVTCGVGVKVEEMCEVTPAGERRNCSLLRSSCLTSWMCGLLHFTIPAGRPFQLSCLASDTVGFESGAYSYSWKLAPGLITVNDVLFKPFNNTDSALRLSPAREADAGTYRCDVQMLKVAKVVKRIYFGIRVIRNALVHLDYRKSLTWEQKLLANEQEGSPENHTLQGLQQQQHFWQGEFFSVCLIGVGSGVIGGVLVSVAGCVLKQILRR